jgi:glycosyltransferase involved in cell wall biosynthesis
MKNILQLIGSFHQGGSERQAVQLTSLLHSDKNFKIFVATLNKDGVLLDEIARLDLSEIPEFKLTSFYDKNFFEQIRKCVRFLRENNIEIIHTHDFYTNIFGMAAARLAGTRFKVASKRETGGMRSKAQRFVEKLAFRQADKIVANSKAVKDYLTSEGISPEKIELIYNGLDLERFKTLATDKRQICQKIGLPFNESIKFVTLVANLRHRVKNQPMFLRAAQKVIRKFPNVHFVLAGEGELKAELEKLAEDLKVRQNTHFIGLCREIPELLYVSYTCVLTSFYEGFSNSILEYMAAGKPVVATNVGGANEAIIENETGFLVEPDDDDALANRLLELLQDEEKARKFGLAGKKIAAERFSCERQLQLTLKLYQTVS